MRASASEGKLRGILGRQEGAFPRPPSNLFRSHSPAFRPNNREPGKEKAAQSLAVHPGSRPRLQRLVRSAALVAGLTASSQQIVWTS